jgi:hypothetical protein
LAHAAKIAEGAGQFFGQAFEHGDRTETTNGH